MFSTVCLEDTTYNASQPPSVMARKAHRQDRASPRAEVLHRDFAPRAQFRATHCRDDLDSERMRLLCTWRNFLEELQSLRRGIVEQKSDPVAFQPGLARLCRLAFQFIFESVRMNPRALSAGTPLQSFESRKLE